MNAMRTSSTLLGFIASALMISAGCTVQVSGSMTTNPDGSASASNGGRTKSSPRPVDRAGEGGADAAETGADNGNGNGDGAGNGNGNGAGNGNGNGNGPDCIPGEAKGHGKGKGEAVGYNLPKCEEDAKLGTAEPVGRSPRTPRASEANPERSLETPPSSKREGNDGKSLKSPTAGTPGGDSKQLRKPK